MDIKKFQFYESRIELFLEKLNKSSFLLDSCKLNALCYPSKDHVTFAKRLELTALPIQEGEVYGGEWENAWFHFSAEMPQSYIGKNIAVRLNLGGEIMICDDNGVPIYGLTHTSVFSLNYTKEYFTIIKNAKQGDKIDFWCEAAAHGLIGKENALDDSIDNCCGLCSIMEVGIFHEDLWQFYADFRIVHSLFKSYDPKSARAVQLLVALNEAINIYEDNSLNAGKARLPLQKILNCRALDSEFTTTTIGHAHIDVGWLWQVKESIRKAARTFASQIDLIQKYPDYIFGASQPQLYAFVKEHYPELYAKIKQAIADDRWEVQGGMWVEADCNIISGESMVRQFVHGKNFFMDEFGIEVKNLWLPDVFGYSANLPQIIKKSGCDYFLTQKLSWNQFNKFPYHTFNWFGIDGSCVLTHFPPEDNYGSNSLPHELIYAKNNFNENYFLSEYMTLIGIGDGGGGPSERYIENTKRCQNLEGVPKVKFGMAKDYFSRISTYSDQLSTWHGELYLEMHRGTLTSQAKTKQFNRKLEQLLTVAEFLCSCLPFEEYPKETFDKNWKKLLTNQFHDIIPGSSIREVYETSEKEYKQIEESVSTTIYNCEKQLKEEDNNSLTIVNTLSYDSNVIVKLPESWKNYKVKDKNNNFLPIQKEGNSYYTQCNVNPQSFTVLTKTEPCNLIDSQVNSVDDLILENELIRYEFNSNGQLSSIFDKILSRELSTDKCGNLLQLYVDDPNRWDAWDIDFTYRERVPETAKAISCRKVSAGVLRQTLEFEFVIGNSNIKQQVVLNNHSKKLDFITQINWQESHKMLRVSFPVNIYSTEAICDIQYGYLKRNIHTNTSWEFAKFEMSAHRYVAVEDAICGVALLNDCKYGYHLECGLLDLNLLRSPKVPDPQADMGEHELIYSFMPYESGNLMEVQKEAAMLNRPVTIFEGKVVIEFPVRLLNNSGVNLEILKKAEKSDNLVIRLVETLGKFSKTTLSLNANQIMETNLIEWEKSEPLKVENNMIELEFKPFEIKTFIIN